MWKQESDVNLASSLQAQKEAVIAQGHANDQRKIAEKLRHTELAHKNLTTSPYMAFGHARKAFVLDTSDSHTINIVNRSLQSMHRLHPIALSNQAQLGNLAFSGSDAQGRLVLIYKNGSYQRWQFNGSQLGETNTTALDQPIERATTDLHQSDMMYAVTDHGALIGHHFDNKTIWSVPQDGTTSHLRAGHGMVCQVRDGNIISVYASASGALRQRLTIPGGQIRQLSMSPTQPLLAAAQWNGTITLIDLSKESPTPQIIIHGDAITTLNFAPDGETLYAGSWNGTVGSYRRDVAWKQTHMFQASHRPINGLHIPPNTEHIRILDRDGMVTSWLVPQNTDLRPRKKVSFHRQLGTDCAIISFAQGSTFCVLGTEANTSNAQLIPFVVGNPQASTQKSNAVFTPMTMTLDSSAQWLADIDRKNNQLRITRLNDFKVMQTYDGCGALWNIFDPHSTIPFSMMFDGKGNDGLPPDLIVSIGGQNDYRFISNPTSLMQRVMYFEQTHADYVPLAQP